MTDKIVVLSTCETAEQAAGIARRLVEARLDACVNIVPGARSIYQWKGAVEEATEVLLLIKTSRALLGPVRAEIARIHSYEVPEVIALQIVGGSEAYLDWLDRELKPPDSDSR